VQIDTPYSWDVFIQCNSLFFQPYRPLRRLQLRIAVKTNIPQWAYKAQEICFGAPHGYAFSSTPGKPQLFLHRFFARPLNHSAQRPTSTNVQQRPASGMNA
jgi:hypothetical protein